MQSEFPAGEASEVPHPVVIVSAARSGSKLLRDLICAARDCSCYPYDVNYVWKYGNYHVQHDELSPEMLDEEKKRFIRMFLFRPAKKSNALFAVDKTVSNSLRVEYVRRVLPEAKIIHLVRDGRDVIASAMDCWKKIGVSRRNQDHWIMWRKLIEFPPQGWRYAMEYVRDNVGMVFGKRNYRNTWGPRFSGIDDAVATQPLAAVCSLQWEACIGRALKDLSSLDMEEDYVTVKYEKLISSPKAEIDRIVGFLGIQDEEPLHSFSRDHFTSSNVGKWKRMTDVELWSRIERNIQPTLERLGYD